LCFALVHISFNGMLREISQSTDLSECVLAGLLVVSF
jgi:hypothetical protein